MAAPMKKTVELFYDVVSPYSWIAFEVLTRYKSVWGNMDLKLRPFFLGGVMNESSNRPPAMVPAKGAYMMKYDIPRLGTYYQVPIKIPKNPSEVMFEKGSLTAMRFITAVDIDHPECTENLSRELWMRAWCRDEGIFNQNDFLEAAKKVGISEEIAKNALARIKDDDVKNRLKKNTTEALNYGTFGAPTIIAHVNNKPELVFGSDRFPILAMLLDEEWKGPQAELSKCKL
ncbi:glutathione S-transferase kappa 1-like [Mytilus galloprovincialis]|uniref:Glutathione S-transferase kappa n=2 Tax=Mytilus TaxID=6548 RepID=A0A8B6DPN9_MYTGA|nr:GSTK1 [Mytilus edulis]VDI22039.1 glutathione S-transferase kappa 1 [Mytilus galloprovincialis]